METLGIKIQWGQYLGKSECPYIKRWVLDFGPFSIRIHHWLSSDDQRHYHDHPWWYISFVLKGAYTDKSPDGSKIRKPGTVSYFKAEHKHTVEVPKTGCWTLLITGPEKRQWGFWVNNKFRKRNKYFFENGHHPCD